MLGDDEMVLLAASGTLWAAAAVAWLARRRRLARWLAGAAIVASLGAVLWLRAGTGHRA
jgi:hypothetical protein